MSAVAAFAAPARAETYTGPGMPINDGATASSTITITTTRRILDVNAVLNSLSHTWVGDLVIWVTSPDGLIARLISRPGVGASGFGNSADLNGNYTFDDEAGAPVPASGGVPQGSYRPVDNLSRYDGLSAAGTWTLTISDQAGLDSGNLGNWQLVMALAAGCSATSSPGFDRELTSTNSTTNLDIDCTGATGAQSVLVPTGTTIDTSVAAPNSGSGGDAVTDNVGGAVWSLTNRGTVIGQANGVHLRDAGSAVTNESTITGRMDDGVFLEAGGSVVNAAGATITSQGTDSDDFAIDILGGAADVTNAGTLAGGAGGAIRFGTFDDRLELHAGSVINGNVFAGTGLDALVLGGADNATFDLAELGDAAQYRDFETLTKEGASTWTLTGTSDFSGNATLSSGTLVVNGAIGSTVFMDGGVLAGTGTIGGLSARAGGTVAPGAGPGIGTLNVDGNVTFDPTLAYDVEIAASGASDLIDASGSALLTGGTVNVLTLDPEMSYINGQRFLILEADGGVIGSFSTLNETSAFTDFYLTYELTQVFLHVQRFADFASVAETPNQAETARALEDFDQTFGSDSLATYNAIAMLSADEARAAFDLMSGEAHASFQHTVAEAAGLFASTLQRRAGLSLGANTSGIRSQPLGYSMNGRDGSLPFHALAALPGVPVDPAPAAGEPATGIWASLLGGFGQLDADGNAAALEHRIGGLAGGYDALFDGAGGAVLVGISGGYSLTEASVDARRSSADIGSAHLGVYGAWDNDRMRLSAAAAYGFHAVDATRRIVFRGVDETAEAEYDAHSVAVSAEAAYRFGLGGITLAPLATLDLLAGRHDGATETGAGALNLTIDAESFSRVQSGLGVAFGSEWAIGSTLISAEGRLLWGHAFGDDAPSQSLAFAGAPGTPFTVLGPERAEDWLGAGAGLGVSLSDALSVTARYDGAFSGSGDRHQGHLSVGYRF
jgi:outer membrane autotransporter protein